MSASYEFLSDAWFDELDKLIEQNDQVSVPANIEALSINFEVEQGDEVERFALHSGLLQRKPIDDAQTTVCLDDANALKMALLQRDPAELIELFMMGRVRVDGDISQLMAAQMFQPTPEHQVLLDQINAMTE